ncbi:hypothetical protein ACIQF6_31485 [Kitasatospora sp. NPDC092948]|uniref:hypothetical protein n=1 Tax=Kitasatospora sp. NPDC092948 TaxID=3364088 RepID=UPI00381B88A5
MGRTWNADLSAPFAERLGRSAAELGSSDGRDECPDIWQLANGDIAVIGTDATDSYRGRLPEGVRIGAGERLIVIPGALLTAAKPDIPDA